MGFTQWGYPLLGRIPEITLVGVHKHDIIYFLVQIYKGLKCGCKIDSIGEVYFAFYGVGIAMKDMIDKANNFEVLLKALKH